MLLPFSFPARSFPLVLRRVAICVGTVVGACDVDFCYQPIPAARIKATKPSFDDALHPLHLGPLGAQAIVIGTNALTGLIQSPCGAQNRRSGGFYG